MEKDTSAVEWFRMEVSEAMAVSGTTQEHGLNAHDVAERRQQYGRNLLTVRRAKGPLVRFLQQFHQPLIYVLLIAAGISTLGQLASSGELTRRVPPGCHALPLESSSNKSTPLGDWA